MDVLAGIFGWIWEAFHTLAHFFPMIVLGFVLVNRRILQRLNTQSTELQHLHAAMLNQYDQIMRNAQTCHINGQSLETMQRKLQEEEAIHDSIKELIIRTETRSSSILTMAEVIDELMRKVYPEAAKQVPKIHNNHN